MKLVRINGSIYGVGANGKLQRQLQSAKKIAVPDAASQVLTPSLRAVPALIASSLPGSNVLTFRLELAACRALRPNVTGNAGSQGST